MIFTAGRATLGIPFLHRQKRVENLDCSVGFTTGCSTIESWHNARDVDNTKHRGQTNVYNPGLAQLASSLIPSCPPVAVEGRSRQIWVPAYRATQGRKYQVTSSRELDKKATADPTVHNAQSNKRFGADPIAVSLVRKVVCRYRFRVFLADCRPRGVLGGL